MHKIAIIGGGPAGCAMAMNLLKNSFAHQKDLSCSLQPHIFEQLPVPFGLSRYGIAPDHYSMKNVEDVFKNALFLNSNCKIYTNVHVALHKPSIDHTGTDGKYIQVNSQGVNCIPIDCLYRYYSAIIIATGAPYPRIPLDTPGLYQKNSQSPIAGVLTARALVNYYNAYPTSAHNEVYRQTYATTVNALSRGIAHVCIVGNGNVALDCVRILVLSSRINRDNPANCLLRSDISEDAKAKLGSLSLRTISVIARHGYSGVRFYHKKSEGTL